MLRVSVASNCMHTLWPAVHMLWVICVRDCDLSINRDCDCELGRVLGAKSRHLLRVPNRDRVYELEQPYQPVQLFVRSPVRFL